MKFEEVHLHELKQKAPAELLGIAEDLEIENASTLRKQDMMFAILKELAEQDVPITGEGVLEVMAVVDLFSGFNKLMDGLRVEPDEKPWYG